MFLQSASILKYILNPRAITVYFLTYSTGRYFPVYQDGTNDVPNTRTVP